MNKETKNNINIKDVKFSIADSKTNSPRGNINHMMEIKEKMISESPKYEDYSPLQSSFQKTKINNTIYEKRDSNEDITRVEQKWSDENEKLLNEWSKECNDNAIQHRKKAHKNKVLYKVFGLSSTILPVCLVAVKDFFQKESIVMSVFLMTIGTINGITQFMNFSKNQQQNYEAETKYLDLELHIKTILAKHRKYRQSSSTVITHCMLTLSNIKSSVPSL